MGNVIGAGYTNLVFTWANDRAVKGRSVVNTSGMWMFRLGTFKDLTLCAIDLSLTAQPHV